ncbi:MAG: hypothetical protein OHK0048_01870 [Rhodoferax sp.]
MNAFEKNTAIRIASVSIGLTCIASPVAWYVQRENAENAIVSLAIEESGRLLHRFDAIDLQGPQAQEHARQAAEIIAGGMFDIAEIYDAKGKKLAESLTVEGRTIEPLLPSHGKPNYDKPFYLSARPRSDLWALRVFVPLRNSSTDMSLPITGYFEGVRVMPPWQKDQIFFEAMTAAIMIGLASLVCGLVMYPVVIRLAGENERKAREVLDSHIAMMESLGRAIAKRDSDTGAHNYRVAWLAANIGERMGFAGDAMQSLIAGSFLHDVGKIGIPDAILLKPGKLDAAELEVMRTHVTQGRDIVTGMGWLDGANAVVACHHEKWDGSGYPRGLKGEAIPLSARIFAVADVFDALCSRRPYKEPMSFEQAMAILDKDTGTHFDPSVMAVFKPMARRLYDELAQCDEDGARKLLENQVRRHFEINSA